jgi:hypothetical protein
VGLLVPGLLSRLAEREETGVLLLASRRWSWPSDGESGGGELEHRVGRWGPAQRLRFPQPANKHRIALRWVPGVEERGPRGRRARSRVRLTARTRDSNENERRGGKRCATHKHSEKPSNPRRCKPGCGVGMDGAALRSKGEQSELVGRVRAARCLLTGVSLR